MTLWTALDPYGDQMTDGRSTQSLNRVIELDSPFRVEEDRTVVDYLPNIHAPAVMNDPDGDVEVDDDRWMPLTGHTGQYGYSGAVMHPSEILAGGLAADILGSPGVYVVTEVRDEHNDYPDGDPIGWAVLRLMTEV